MAAANPLTIAIAELMAHIRACGPCQRRVRGCAKGEARWEVIIQLHYARIRRCVDAHLAKHPGIAGAQNLTDKLMRIARVLEPK